MNIRKDVPVHGSYALFMGPNAPGDLWSTKEVVVLKVSHLFRLMGLSGAVGGVARDGTLSSGRVGAPGKNTKWQERTQDAGGIRPHYIYKNIRPKHRNELFSGLEWKPRVLLRVEPLPELSFPKN